MNLAESTEPASVGRSSSKADDLWQRRLLPFMMGSLVFVMFAFLAITLFFFSDLQNRLDFHQRDVVADFAGRFAPTADKADSVFRDWYVRAALEQTALHQRFNVQTTIVKARLWTRFMGFMTGMLLALTGCVFVLGKLRESINFSAQGGGLGTTLATSSPGVFLALLGTIIISVSLSVQASVESTDSSVYLPRQVQVSSDGGITWGDENKPPPVPLPSGSINPAQAEIPPMPPAVLKKVREQATKSMNK